jgi:hypothetical protein
MGDRFFKGASSFVSLHKDMFMSIVPQKADEIEASAPMVSLVMTIVSCTR